jgi:two-component system, response regulator, stage 0 sporulation protein F
MPKNDLPSLLIVDDEVEILLLLKDLFESRGYEVVISENGEAAIEYASKKRFSAILVDLKMPGIDGIQLVEQLKRFHHVRKIVVMSGYGSQVQDSLEEIGVKNYIIKPIDFDFLLSKINSIVNNNNTH